SGKPGAVHLVELPRTLQEAINSSKAIHSGRHLGSYTKPSDEIAKEAEAFLSEHGDDACSAKSALREAFSALQKEMRSSLENQSLLTNTLKSLDPDGDIAKQFSNGVNNSFYENSPSYQKLKDILGGAETQAEKLAPVVEEGFSAKSALGTAARALEFFGSAVGGAVVEYFTDAPSLNDGEQELIDRINSQSYQRPEVTDSMRAAAAADDTLDGPESAYGATSYAGQNDNFDRPSNPDDSPSERGPGPGMNNQGYQGTATDTYDTPSEQGPGPGMTSTSSSVSMRDSVYNQLDPSQPDPSNVAPAELESAMNQTAAVGYQAPQTAQDFEPVEPIDAPPEAPEVSEPAPTDLSTTTDENNPMGWNDPNNGGDDDDDDDDDNDDNPVLLDLSGKGLTIKTLNASTHYQDMTGHGELNHTAWAADGEGVLAIDVNGDGKIDQLNEIDFKAWDPSAKTDLEAIAHLFDSNHNGKLDVGDAAFLKFRVVVDGKVETLAEAGISSINLMAFGAGQTFTDGSKTTGTTTFTRTDGTIALRPAHVNFLHVLSIHPEKAWLNVLRGVPAGV
ncbi:hypothetical protein, partial [Rhizobium sp.]|uniref:hypothetical protein n=1 Tax=Rhizobium sp. TaxID=391 RepID=UPI000E8CE4BF|nr:hypothetical protein [Rhizobium sp.]